MREDRLHLLMGNEAAARGAVEASVSVAIGYPGTPSTEVIEILIQWSKETGMRAEWAVNEKVAFDVATGASLGGVRCLVTMKSAGLNVASDSIMSVAYGDIVGGLVIYVADDPGAHAGMEEQDARAFDLGYEEMRWQLQASSSFRVFYTIACVFFADRYRVSWRFLRHRHIYVPRFSHQCMVGWLEVQLVDSKGRICLPSEIKEEIGAS